MDNNPANNPNPNNTPTGTDDTVLPNPPAPDTPEAAHLRELVNEEIIEETSDAITETKPEVSTEQLEITNTEETKKSKTPLIATIAVLLILGIAGGATALLLGDHNPFNNETDNSSSNNQLEHVELAHELQDFDLRFLPATTENKDDTTPKLENKLYSPLSIKYALGMVAEGANGNSKTQIQSLVGSYLPNNYPNNEHVSFANALFVNNSYKDYIVDTYPSTLMTKFNADVIYDPFATPNTINNWVSNKTFGLINNMFDDVSDFNFILTNALAIDMEWNNKIQGNLWFNPMHINYSKNITAFEYTGQYHELDFDDADQKVKSLEIGTIANRYNILDDLGEDNIRETIRDAYNAWLLTDAAANCYDRESVNDLIDRHMKELGDGNYNLVKSSTDFTFYDDDDYRVFAKDLQDYDGLTLQYVGIMPKTQTLDDYVQNTKAANITDLINKLQPIELDTFKDGVFTEITGYIPVFNFDYELDLIEALKNLGITDVFDASKSNLSDLSTIENTTIDVISHKTTIDFSNDGIKAAAVTAAGGRGAGRHCFDYNFDIPVETIDLTFDSPYLFLIREKDTGEVWFTGTVYEPTAM